MYPSFLVFARSASASSSSSSHLPHLFLLLFPFPFLSFLASYTLCLSLNMVHLRQHQQKTLGTELKDYIRGGIGVYGQWQVPSSSHSYVKQFGKASLWQLLTDWEKMRHCSMLADVHQLNKIQTLLSQNRNRKYPHRKWTMCKSVLSFKCMHFLLKCHGEKTRKQCSMKEMWAFIQARLFIRV